MTGEIPAAATALPPIEEQHHGPSKSSIVFMAGLALCTGVMVPAVEGAQEGSGTEPIAAVSPQPNASFRIETAQEHRTEERTRQIELAVQFVIAQKHQEDIRKSRELQSLINQGFGPPTPAERVFLTCTIGHESKYAGVYVAVDPSGTYFGAYQFDQPTWNHVAEQVGKNELTHGVSWFGIRPDHAPPDIQDYFASVLHRQRGAGPWVGRCANV